ncbi:hypothetical protein D2Q93_15435, partial [Alicyclobacillaceae bacterium I2511]
MVARQSHGFSAFALEAVADEMRRTTWPGEHLDSHVAQKLADRAFAAVQKVAFGQARKVRFKGKRGLQWSSTKAAYRFFSNEKVTVKAIYDSQREATLDKMQDQSIVLA